MAGDGLVNPNDGKRRQAAVAHLLPPANSAAMKSETAKLPKGHSYFLRPSALEGALAASRLKIDTHLIRRPGTLFDAHFWPSNEAVPHERLYVRAGTVPRHQAADAWLRTEQVAIPALIAWIRDIVASDAKSPMRREQQYLNLHTL